MTPPTFATKLFGTWSIWRLPRLLLLIYGTVCVYAWFFSERQMFMPQPVSYGAGDVTRMLPVADSTGDSLGSSPGDARQIALLSLPNPNAKLTLLYSHGNAEDLGDIRPKLELIRDSGYSVVAYDYAGYGLSEGRPNEKNTYRDIEAVYRYLLEDQGVLPEQLVVYGRSIGGGPSLYLASRQPVAGLIIESSFVSIFRVLTRVPLIPFDKFPNRSRIRQVSVPVLMMHGTADDVIPFWHGEALYAAAPGVKRSLWVEGAGHNDFTWVAGDRYAQALRDFAQLLRG